MQLSQYLGIKPNLSGKNSVFNLKTGAFENHISSKYSASKKNTELLIHLLNSNYEKVKELKINASQRHDFLSMFLTYFELHLEGFKKPKSLEILNTVFH